jgi:Protein of unknown function (DUF3011)
VQKRIWISLLAIGTFVIPLGLHAQSGITEADGRNVTCASDDGRRHYCPVNTRFGVEIVRQRSGSPCIEGRTWGFDRQGIWVDRGCRADFVLGRPDHDHGGWDRDHDRDHDRDRDHPGPPPPGDGYGPNRDPRQPPAPEGEMRIRCSSDDGGRHYCSIDPEARVRIDRQVSGSPCIEGKTWGYDRRGLWVDRGCRADFIITRH